MQPYQQRVLDEKAELDQKLSDLLEFSKTTEFDALDENDQRKLVRQSVIMSQLSHVLCERINSFAPDLGVTPYDVIIVPTRPR